MLTHHLPPEILHLIFSQTSRRDLTSLCLVSQAVYHIASDILYESISFDLFEDDFTTDFWTRQNGDPRFHSLYRTLIERPNFALLVKKLHILFYLRKFSQGAVPPLDVVSSQLGMLASVIRKCANLQDVYIAHEFALADSAIRDLNESLLSLSRLRKLRVAVKDTRYQGLVGRPRHLAGETDVGVSLLQKAFILSCVQNLDVTLQEGPDSLLRNLDFPINENITKLSLSEACFDPNHLSKILAALPRIEELCLSFFLFVEVGSTSTGSCLDSEDLGSALATSCSTLVNLKIELEFDLNSSRAPRTRPGEDAGYALSRRLGSLRSYTRLKSLELPPEMLLGWNERTAPELSDVLPEKLETLHFRHDLSHRESSPWCDFSPLCNKLGNYLGDCEVTMPKKLILSHFPDGSRLGMLDFVESKCLGRGVRLVVIHDRSGSTMDGLYLR
ncbi:hypothetical protein F5B19DRAFT_502832 [Rostrohypoxylon terebratum]|nr:hypothetical protein F5B19DRAFT_502832 [Rostrohypoxylon terebratum]